MCTTPRCFTPLKNHPKGLLWLENIGWTVSKFWPGIEMGT